MSVEVRAAPLVGRSSHSSCLFSVLCNIYKLFLPENLADSVSVCDVLSAVEAGSRFGCLRSLSRSSCSGNWRGRGRSRSRSARFLRTLLEYLTRKGSRRVRWLFSSSVSKSGLLAVGRWNWLLNGWQLFAFAKRNLDIAREFNSRTKDILELESLGKGGVKLARGSLSLADNVEQRAILDAARWVRAGVDGLLEEVPVPTSNEIGMHTVTFERLLVNTLYTIK
jgi:hypothetical protein